MSEKTSSILVDNLVTAYSSGRETGRVSLRILGNEICEIGERLAPAENEKHIDGSNMVAIPGLVNTHHHFF